MGEGESRYTVAEFSKKYDFSGREIERVSVNVSGDTAFLLFTGKKQLLRGPAGVGGDFLYNDILRPEYYSYHLELTPDICPSLAYGEISFYALVRMGSVRICEYSRGAGGFMLEGKVFFAGGEETDICSDESWDARFIGAYTKPYGYKGSIPADTPVKAEKKTPPVKTVPAPIPPCEEHLLPLENSGEIYLAENRSAEMRFFLDKIYACFISVYVETDSPVFVKISGGELPGGTDWAYELRFDKNAVFRGMELQSAGEISVEIKKETSSPCRVRVEAAASCYPAPERAKTATSDNELNRVLEVCAHSLKYCRQTIHLDSPKHCEPLACTGDYYIETLMTAFTFGDMRLSKFDIHRTANLLLQHGGEMFHTSYSLIWVLMLWDVYLFTGDRDVLFQNTRALGLLLDRFEGYIGKNGLIETPPNFMFIDWLDPDGINLHHPPKALGQTCMCMFYYGALKTAQLIYYETLCPEKAAEVRLRADKLHRAVHKHLWDKNRKLFFEGLNTPTPDSLIYNYMPQNVEKRYYRRHANILAAYFGFFGERTNRALLRRILSDDTLGEVQPYFQHFLLDAVYRCGLREEYTVKLLNQWKAPIAECPKGLPEGFFKPNPDYRFDRSHAWAGTPAYALPLALSGLKMLQPGFKKISLSPSSLGLESAKTEIPTPFGYIKISVEKSGKTKVDIPAGIETVSSP